MGWMQKLCDVYDLVSAVDIPEGENHAQLVRVGFTKKNVDYVVTITSSGNFSSVSELDRDNCECIVPTTPQAEGRTGANGAPYPLAENLKYFAEEEGIHNTLLDAYLEQLTAWCNQNEAPDCLKTLLTYLEKRSLLTDVSNALPKKLKLHKSESEKDFSGADAKAMICFAVEDHTSREMRLWKRKDVQDSWTAYCARKTGGKAELCYVTGKMMPLLDNHPKVQGNAKLISAKDAGYPFQYKGRFAEDRSAASVSAYASDRAHRALQYLLTNQGLSIRKFGLNIVAWDVQTGAVKVPLIGSTGDSDDDEDSVVLPDTFEAYSKTLCRAAVGQGRTAKAFEECISNLKDGESRASSVVIMSMESATDGRMSIDYYQELPDDLYVDRLTDWYRSCCWMYWDKGVGKYVVRTPMPLTIADAVMGPDAVRRAKADLRCEKSDSKQMRGLYKRLLNCIVDAAPLPLNFLQSAVHRAEAPLTCHDNKGNWDRFQWEMCLRTTCALIRRSCFDKLTQSEQADCDLYLPSDQLDQSSHNRSYLYGRLIAIADLIEYKATDDPAQRNLPTNAIRLMQRFAQRPKETWFSLHAKLIPYLASLDSGGANAFMSMISDVELLFEREDRESTFAVDENFLLGYIAQRQAYFTKREADGNVSKEDSADYHFGSDRSECFGMLAAIADCAENLAMREERDGRKEYVHEGRTNALRMMVQLTQQPVVAWSEIHAKLLSYMEKLGIRRSAGFNSMLRIVECGFDCNTRLDNSPLNSMFLNGFYRMRACILSNGKPVLETVSLLEIPDTRDEVYAALLAIENSVERTVLDLEKHEEDNRASNALRLMNKFAMAPASTWYYLEERMQPYLRKLRTFSAGGARKIEDRLSVLNCAIRENKWDSDEPLSPGWLHGYYTLK